MLPDKEREIKRLNEMKELMSELGVIEGNKYEDLKSIDKEIEILEKSSLK